MTDRCSSSSHTLPTPASMCVDDFRDLEKFHPRLAVDIDGGDPITRWCSEAALDVNGSESSGGLRRPSSYRHQPPGPNSLSFHSRLLILPARYS